MVGSAVENTVWSNADKNIDTMSPAKTVNIVRLSASWPAEDRGGVTCWDTSFVTSFVVMITNNKQLINK